MRSDLRFKAVILAVLCSSGQAIAQTQTYCTTHEYGMSCTTTPTPKSGWEQLHDTLAQIRRDREERQRQNDLKELERRHAEEEAAAAAQHEAFQAKLEKLRQQGERLMQQQENQQRAAEALNMAVSQAILEHRCDDAKTTALTAGNLELADRAMRLCTPLRAAPQARPTGAKKRGAPAPARPRVAAQAQPSVDRQSGAAPYSEPKIQSPNLSPLHPSYSANPTTLPKPNSRVKQPLAQSFVVTMPEPSGSFPRGPEPANDPGTWIKATDYPSEVLGLRVSGSTFFQLTVSHKGKVLECGILSSTGNQYLDNKTCHLIKLRSGFFPARDVNGRPVIGNYTNSINWNWIIN